jgi:hypothetical protein
MSSLTIDNDPSGGYIVYKGTVIAIPIQPDNTELYLQTLLTLSKDFIIEMMRRGSTLQEIKTIIQKNLDTMIDAFHKATKEFPAIVDVPADEYRKITNEMAKAIGSEIHPDGYYGVYTFLIQFMAGLNLRIIEQDERNAILLVKDKTIENAHKSIILCQEKSKTT